ncbi:MAG: o-succinylbenzoate--CoA ligase [Corynebacterium sp.]|nr:o-succinylbenzoate--CoA ligase [Corynebacterium sp.]
MAKVLHPLSVSLADPAAILPDLEAAISGEKAFLPVPAEDPTKAMLLRNTQRVGEEIASDIALVVPTSGSTGTPKGAQLSAVNLVASADATHARLGGPGHWVLALPATHIAGIQVLVRCLLAGVEPVCVDLSHGFSVEGFASAAQVVADTGEQAYTALTPMQLAKAMDSLVGIEALRVFDAVLVGGATLDERLRTSAQKLDIAVISTYGSSETAGGCVYDGYPLDGVQVEVKAGRIYLGGPTIAHGYRNVPEHEAFAQQGWFATSDGGQLCSGKLEVTGRLDNIIVSGGLKLHPEVLEEALHSIPGVDTAVVTSTPHPRVGDAIVAAYVGNATLMDIMSGLEDLGTPRWQVPKDLKRLPQMPLTVTGKVDRQAIRALWQS